jgi:hypothetical protein
MVSTSKSISDDDRVFKSITMDATNEARTANIPPARVDLRFLVGFVLFKQIL